jgi:hypothetical protein
VRGQAEILDDAAGQHHGVVAVADVHPGTDGIDRGGTAARLIAGLEHHDVAPGPRQVGGAGQPVVAAADDEDIGAIRRRHGPFTLIDF